MKKTRWLPSIAVAFLLAAPLTFASGLSYDNPPPDRQRGELRDRPEVASDGPSSRAGSTVTDATGQSQQSTWSTWGSSPTREAERLYFEGGGRIDSTVSPSSMLSGRLEWDNGVWSDCKTSASNEYCGTVVSGVRERSVWCDFQQANGSASVGDDGLCIAAQGAKPDTTLSCQMAITTDCVYPPVIVSLNAAPAGKFLADGTDVVTFTATVHRTTGEVAAGETVNWSTTRGALNRTATTTNSSGVTSITLRSSSIGMATVKATSDKTSMSESVEFVTPIPDFVGITASPNSGLLANGSNRSTITATLQYANGKRASGQSVSFTTSRGNLSRGSTTTNAKGLATVTLSSTSHGSATITAQHSNKKATTSVTFDEVMVPRITGISASPTSGIEADGSSGSTITATVKNQHGSPVSDELVSFSTSLGRLHQSSAWTNDSGNASAWLTSNQTGTANVSATFAGDSRSTNVGFVATSSVGGEEFTARVNLKQTGSLMSPAATPISSTPVNMGEYRVLDLVTHYVNLSFLLGNPIAIDDLGFTEIVIKTPEGMVINEYDIDPALTPAILSKPGPTPMCETDPNPDCHALFFIDFLNSIPEGESKPLDVIFYAR